MLCLVVFTCRVPNSNDIAVTTPFHLAIPVHDIHAARKFFGGYGHFFVDYFVSFVDNFAGPLNVCACAVGFWDAQRVDRPKRGLISISSVTRYYATGT